MIEEPFFLMGVLALNVAVSEWLARHTPLRHLGSALLVIVLTAVAANLGVIPTYSDEQPVYTGVFTYLAPLAIFWLLLQVNLGGLLRAGLPMIVLFLVGSLGTVAGVICGMAAVGGSEVFGAQHFALGGMFVGTYTGGSVNFNAIALEYDVMKDGTLYAGAAAVDSAMTTLWMAATVVLPRLLASVWPRPRPGTDHHGKRGVGEAITGEQHDTEHAHPMDLAIVLALGAFGVWASEDISKVIRVLYQVPIPSVLLLTSMALILAQFPVVQRLRGTRLVGMPAVMLFLAVIGALCDLSALGRLGELGVHLMIFVTVIVAVHGIIVYGCAALLRLDCAVASVASQANIGGGTSALALARGLGRADLVLPAILVGSLGTALGNYLGFMTASWLQG